MEARRLDAAAELRRGVPQAEVARRYGVHRSNVCRWARALALEGESGIRARYRGAARRLTAAQRADLTALLAEEPPQGARWTGKLLATVIQERYGVTYHERHARKILRELGPVPEGEDASPTRENL